MAGGILITGSSGQVGGEIAKLLPAAAVLGPFHTPTRSEFDLANPVSIRSYIRAQRPRWIINPAAYTAVDKAESDRVAAFNINAEAPRILGEEALAVGASVLHFSTDYVFDGTAQRPYTELDKPNPTCVYGASKLAGEQALAATGVPHLTLRTSWVYGATGKNFMLTMLRLARERTEMKVVADQRGAPTSSRDLAALVVHILTTSPDLKTKGGLYHASSAGETTWHGFAAEIVRRARHFEPSATFATMLPIPTSEYPTPARRPPNSRLNCNRLTCELGWQMPPWQDSLNAVLSEFYSGPLL